ncbi:MAG: ABC transporter permease, partial [Rhodobacteraceae bacterium]|nr:ABC transporter permease [Paracoccaceae bacterium]
MNAPSLMAGPRQWRRRHRTPGQSAGLAVLALLALAALAAPLACTGGPLAAVAPPLMPPAPGPDPALWLGSDDLGRSVACMTAFGLRASSVVATGTLAIALVVGLGTGLAAGAAGGFWDAVLSRLIAAFQVIPRFLLALVVVALFGPSLMLLVLVLGATSWTLVARIARAEAMSLGRRPFVLAAHALGAGPGRIILRHILPNALPPVRSALPLVAGGAIAAEAGLGFLGLGAPEATS